MFNQGITGPGRETDWPLMAGPDARTAASADPNAGSDADNGKPIWDVPTINENANRSGYDWYTNNYGELDDGVLNFGFWTLPDLFNSYYVNEAGTIYGVGSRAQFAPGKTASDAVLTGRTQDRIDRYFNTDVFHCGTNAAGVPQSCAPMIGNGRGFGNTGRCACARNTAASGDIVSPLENTNRSSASGRFRTSHRYRSLPEKRGILKSQMTTSNASPADGSSSRCAVAPSGASVTLHPRRAK